MSMKIFKEIKIMEIAELLFEAKREDISSIEKSTLYRLLIAQGRPCALFANINPSDLLKTRYKIML